MVITNKPIALSVDLEDWYQVHGFGIGPGEWGKCEDRILHSTEKLLELFERCQVRATFFVVGHVADKHPTLIRTIAEAGHEIGSHSYWHRLVYKLSPNEFREDLLRSKRTLEDLTGQAVLLYRAPSWSITKSSLWALEILEQLGFIGDSSIQPFATPLSGISGAPIEPYHPIIGGRSLKIIEFPPTVLPLGCWRIPFCGGFYLRAMPLPVLSWALRRQSQVQTAMIYIHPWELDLDQPRLPGPLHMQAIHYLNLASTKTKLDQILRRFQFSPLGGLMQSEQYPQYPIVGNHSQAGEGSHR